MSSEEFAWWEHMIELDWIGPHRQARLLAHIAAGVRNPTLKGPNGDNSLWSADEWLPPERWEFPRIITLAEMRKRVRTMFAKKK